MKKLLFLFFAELVIQNTYAQRPEIQFDRISVQQGLIDHSINSIMQDHNGFLWIGSNYGLYKYDGYDFTFFKAQPGCKNCPSSKSVYKIQEDGLGLLWIKSDNGISLFDPVRERSLLVYSSSSDSLNTPYNLNPDMLRDYEGNIWASSSSGLIKISYDYTLKKPLTSKIIFGEGGKNIFKKEKIQLSAIKSGQDNSVSTLFEDNEGNLWVGCISGLYLKKRENRSFIRLDEKMEKGTHTGFLDVKAIVEIDENSYLIATRNNLWLLKNVKAAIHDKIPDISLLQFSKKQIIGNQIPMSLLVDRLKNILLGTGKEIYKVYIDPKTDEISFELLKSNMADPEDIGYNKEIRDIFEDRSGVLWAAQSYFGITKFNLIQSQFTSYKNLIINNFKSADINPILKDSKGNLWIGTFGGGLYKIQKESFNVTQYESSIGKNNIICMQETSPGYFWIGLNTGIIEFNSNNGKFVDPFPNNTRVENNLRGSVVWDLLKDGGRLYIGTLCGLFVYDMSEKKVFQYSLIKNDSLNDNYNAMRSLLKLRDGDLLVGTPKQGINKINFNENTGKISLSQVVKNKLLTDNGINLFHRHKLYEDGLGFLWILDLSGLHRLNMQTFEVKNFKLFEKIDFPDAWSITEDNHDNFWIGTHYGLCRFNKNTGIIKVFTKENGVPITIHGFNSVYKDTDGRLYFGGIGGFYDFNPDDLKTNDSIPPVVITDLQIFNKSIKVDTSGKGILDQDISFTKSIQLPFNQNDLTFKFAALDYNQPLKNKYAYKLEGYQKEWTETDGNNRIVRYNKLGPGTYVFRVKGSNNDEVWNESGTSLKIIIKKPWWETYFALCSYIILLIFTISGFIRWRVWRLGMEKTELERKVRIRTQQIQEQKEKILTQRDILEEQNKKITENEQLKSKFFTNVSHEFRTPLSLIQTPVEELLNDPKRTEKERRKLNMVQRNAKRLLDLVNQLLDISKIDSSNMKLELCEADVIKHLKFIAGTFISLAESKSIQFSCHFIQDATLSWFDADKLEKITTNLLSNAFKFTTDGGEVEFSARYVSNKDPLMPILLELIVKDTGSGIPEKSLDRIFDRFYQVEESVKPENVGTGIGLSLSRDLARLMHGEITLRSETGKGSIFTVLIPLGTEHLNESEFFILKDIPENLKHFKSPQITFNDGAESEEELSGEDGKPVILIVEDNRDIREQLADSLESAYNIKEAVDGISGLKNATELIPDLIITDLMMPRMDGIELCEKLKHDELTSHIPIIILTAKATLEDKINGLSIGADDYIPKPFNMTELKARIANLIEQRKKLRERFSREVTIEPRDISITPLDEKFLNKAISIVEQHMHDENLDLIIFRHEMNMTRSTLFRKLYALTGQSPTEFIRTIRLKRAASLLRQNFGNVSQVSIEVGFNNLSYFNRSFKKLYGMSPIKYIKKR